VDAGAITSGLDVTLQTAELYGVTESTRRRPIRGGLTCILPGSRSWNPPDKWSVDSRTLAKRPLDPYEGTAVKCKGNEGPIEGKLRCSEPAWRHAWQ
jgi:hypothetical protein